MRDPEEENDLTLMARDLIGALERSGLEVPQDVLDAAARPLHPVDIDAILANASDEYIEGSREVLEICRDRGMELNEIDVAVAALKTTKEKAAEQAQAS